MPKPRGKQLRILCCCAGGKVRSVAVKYLLEDSYGYEDVIATGLERNTDETRRMLFNWSQKIIVVGERDLFLKLPIKHLPKAVHFDVGPDVWDQYGHQDLLGRVAPMLERFVRELTHATAQPAG